MFDVGFVELLMVGLVALLVVGPERLPGLARTAGLWIGKMRRMVSSVKRDIEEEIKADELKRILEEQKRKVPMHDIVEKTRGTVQDLKSGAKAAVDPRPAKDEPNKTAGTNEHHSEP